MPAPDRTTVAEPPAAPPLPDCLPPSSQVTFLEPKRVGPVMIGTGV